MITKTNDLKANEIPVYNNGDNPTNCCPRFVPDEWDDRELHFQDKLFVKTKTKSFLHIPINMGPVFKRTFAAIEAAEAQDLTQSLVLSREISLWSAEHFFAVTKEVPGQEMFRLTGDFHPKVFEGPFSNAGKWCEQLKKMGGGSESERVGSEKAESKKAEPFLFYTTCPGCAKHYGNNYVVGLVESTRSAS